MIKTRTAEKTGQQAGKGEMKIWANDKLIKGIDGRYCYTDTYGETIEFESAGDAIEFLQDDGTELSEETIAGILSL
jgi:hypothetical protein